jgi:hypothetical protein
MLCLDLRLSYQSCQSSSDRDRRVLQSQNNHRGIANYDARQWDQKMFCFVHLWQYTESHSVSKAPWCSRTIRRLVTLLFCTIRAKQHVNSTSLRCLSDKINRGNHSLLTWNSPRRICIAENPPPPSSSGLKPRFTPSACNDLMILPAAQKIESW